MCHFKKQTCESSSDERTFVNLSTEKRRRLLFVYCDVVSVFMKLNINEAPAPFFCVSILTFVSYICWLVFFFLLLIHLFIQHESKTCCLQKCRTYHFLRKTCQASAVKIANAGAFYPSDKSWIFLLSSEAKCSCNICRWICGWLLTSVCHFGTVCYRELRQKRQTLVFFWVKNDTTCAGNEGTMSEPDRGGGRTEIKKTNRSSSISQRQTLCHCLS